MSFGEDRPSNLPPNPYAAPLAEEQEGLTVPTRPGELDLNPWVSIWTKPRATIRQIVDTDPTYMAFPIVAVGGAVNGVNNVIANLGATDAAMLVGALVAAALVGALFGLAFWLLGAWVASIAAGWLGGAASLQQMRAAYAWPQVLVLWTVPLTLILLVITGGNVAAAEGNIAVAGAMIAIGLVQMVVGVWSLVVLCKCIGEVSQFSAWLGLGTIIIAGLLIFIPLMVIMIVVVAIVAAAA